MRILFTNDDGVFSQGLRALLLAFAQEGNELYVSAPDAERSGASHSFTMFMPLRAQQVTIPGVEDVTAYAVSGTPVDCVKLAYGNLFPRPDLLISGINLGANRGTDIFLFRNGICCNGRRHSRYPLCCGIQHCVETKLLRGRRFRCKIRSISSNVHAGTETA